MSVTRSRKEYVGRASKSITPDAKDTTISPPVHVLVVYEEGGLSGLEHIWNGDWPFRA
jgi:hypothetical protein